MQGSTSQDKPDTADSNPSAQGVASGVRPDRNAGDSRGHADKGDYEGSPSAKRTLYKPSSEWIMVLFTAVIAFWAGLQWYEMHGSGKQADKLIIAASKLADAAKDQAQAADDTAAAAGDQVDAANNFSDSAEEINRGVSGAVNQLQAAAKNTRTAIENAQTSFRDEQRAWVGVSDVKTIEFSESKPWNVGVIFTNSGRTPARNVQTSVGFRVSEVPISGPYPGDIKQLVFRPAQSIAPEAKFVHALGYFALGEARTPREMQGNQYLVSKFQDIKSGKANVYYFGILKYDDIFGNHRETKFCVFLANPETQKAAFCDGFNDLN